jgi:hypothetical protein
MTTTAVASAINTIVDYSSAFGYNYRTARDSDDAVWYKNTLNIANFISYIPIIRIGVGIWRVYTHIPLIMNRGVDDFSQRVGYSNIARGIAEIVLPDGGLNILLLLIPDIAMTALRYFAHTRART